MSKLTDPTDRPTDECPKCHQVLQPLSNGIPHYCEDRPAFGRQYRLTGASGTKCIANGNSWAESECTGVK